MGCLRLEILENHKPILGKIGKKMPARKVRIHPILRTKKGKGNYYPFGMGMASRSGNNGNYRYGYQGSEKDDEIKGQGNYYTTFFRGLDPRLGKWLSVDPKTTAWESPYVSMGNNPIWYNDPLGDKFIKGSERKARRSEKQAQRRLGKLSKKLAKTYQQYNGEDNIYNQIEDIKAQIQQVTKIKDGIQEMRESEQNYIIKNPLLILRPSKRGATVYNTKHDAVVMIAANKKVKFHELTHGLQFERGELSFKKEVKKMKKGKPVLKKIQSPGKLYDITDEVDAYKTSYAFGDNVFKDFKKRGALMKDFGSETIAIKYPDTYGNLPKDSRNLNNTDLYKEDEFFHK